MRGLEFFASGEVLFNLLQQLKYDKNWSLFCRPLLLAVLGCSPQRIFRAVEPRQCSHELREYAQNLAERHYGILDDVLLDQHSHRPTSSALTLNMHCTRCGDGASHKSKGSKLFLSHHNPIFLQWICPCIDFPANRMHSVDNTKAHASYSWRPKLSDLSPARWP